MHLIILLAVFLFQPAILSAQISNGGHLKEEANNAAPAPLQIRPSTISEEILVQMVQHFRESDCIKFMEKKLWVYPLERVDNFNQLFSVLRGQYLTKNNSTHSNENQECDKADKFFSCLGKSPVASDIAKIIELKQIPHIALKLAIPGDLKSRELEIKKVFEEVMKHKP